MSGRASWNSRSALKGLPIASPFFFFFFFCFPSDRRHKESFYSLFVITLVWSEHEEFHADVQTCFAGYMLFCIRWLIEFLRNAWKNASSYHQGYVPKKHPQVLQSLQNILLSDKSKFIFFSWMFFSGLCVMSNSLL